MIDIKNLKSPQSIEIKRGKATSTIAVSGILALEELSHERITLLCHSGRITVVGCALVLSVFEGRSVEISGKITGVSI